MGTKASRIMKGLSTSKLPWQHEEYLKLLSAQNQLLENHMDSRTLAKALALLPNLTSMNLASPTYSNVFIRSGDQDNGFSNNDVQNRNLLKDPYNEGNDFARASRPLKVILTALALSKTNLEILKLEYVSEFFWYDSEFLPLSDGLGTHLTDALRHLTNLEIASLWLYPLPTTEETFALDQSIKLIESALVLRHLDLALSNANTFSQAEDLENHDSKDYRNMTALYTCLTAKNLRKCQSHGFSTSHLALVEFLESQAPR